MIDLNKNPPPEVAVGLINDENLFHWKATIMGPSDIPYEGGIFFLNYTFQKDYPSKTTKSNISNKNLSSKYKCKWN